MRSQHDERYIPDPDRSATSVCGAFRFKLFFLNDLQSFIGGADATRSHTYYPPGPPGWPGGGGQRFAVRPAAAGRGAGPAPSTAAATEVERERTRQVARIGNNLNQIARWATPIDAVEVIAHLIVIE